MMNDMNSADQNRLGPVLIALMQGVVYREHDAALWQPLLELQARVRDYNCVFHGKLDTDSTANWTPIPRQTGQSVQRKLDTDSTPNWTV